MSGDVGAEVAAVLAAHRLHASMNICTGCDWRATPGAGSLADQHDQHRADVLAPLIAERVEAAKAEALREAAAHGVAWQDRLNIVCLCGAVCSAIVKRSPAPLMGTTSDDYVAAPAAEAFARHLRKARAAALDPEATP